jgi:hypothetical protein
MYKAKSTKNNILKNVHQYIRGLRNKFNEILCHLKEQTPHVLYFTEHHLEGSEIVHLNLDNYILGAYYSRKHFKKGGTCIYVQNKKQNKLHGLSPRANYTDRATAAYICT